MHRAKRGTDFALRNKLTIICFRKTRRTLWRFNPCLNQRDTHFTLWCKFVLLEEQVSEREFNEMSIDEKLDILQGCFDHEIRAFPPPSRLA